MITTKEKLEIQKNFSQVAARMIELEGKVSDLSEAVGLMTEAMGEWLIILGGKDESTKK